MASTPHLLLHPIMIIYVIAIQTISGYACIEVERKALLAFKADISYGTKHGLSSWNQSEDCCSWRGVTCDNNTGNILELNLGNPYNDLDYALSGEINPSLLALNHLTRLDLSYNDFSDISIPKFFGSFKSLRNLNLSNSGFGGKIPHQLGNLSKLQSLDLSSSYFIGTIPPHLGNLSDLQYLSLNEASLNSNVEWLSRLTSLKYLDMSGLDLQNSVNWLQIINKLQSIKVLLLASTFLPSIPNSLSYVNFTGLTTLDLSGNLEFNTTLPSWLGNITNLENLNLENCQFFGKIPNDIAKLTSLTYLNLAGNSFEPTKVTVVGKLCSLRGIDLSDLGIGGDIQELVGMSGCKWKNMEEIILSSNNLQGNLSKWLEQMPNLKHLDLKNNSFAGSVPLGIGKLQNLKFLDLSSNSLHGAISEAHFANLTRLEDLRLSSNSLNISVDQNWVPPFQLTTISLSSCHIGPQFPAWLRWQMQLNQLDLHNTSIAGILPDWLWDLPLTLLDLSFNNITGKLPSSLQSTVLETLALGSNNLEGPLPSLLPTSIQWLSLSNNLINGSIPYAICDCANLWVLDLSKNHLAGELPRCWHLLSSSLAIIDFSSNYITGEIPPSMGSLNSLQSLDLKSNNLYGELPSELQSCKSLGLLDLGNNKFSGKIPIWIGENMSSLVYLKLSSNMFDGSIPSQLAQLSSLHILDLSDNNLSGSIPSSFGNFTAMELGPYFDYIYDGPRNRYDVDTFAYFYNLHLTMQGREIPEEIGGLGMLINLNFSGNYLIGRIPEKIGDMLYLESLDFSSNELSGAIPQSLSKLTYLHHLNLSFNNLSGRIPSGNQLDTLDDPSIYAGNAYLCGPPTSKNCSEDQAASGSTSDYANGFEKIWLYIGMALGFVVGFWSVYIVLLFYKTWRYAYFKMIDNLFDKIYVILAVTMNRLKNKYER